MQRGVERGLIEVLGRTAGARVLVVGDLVLDEYVYGVTDRISREAPVPIVRETARTQVLGGGANVVANVCALGAQCSVIGVLGTDASGTRLEQLIGDAGGKLGGLIRVRGRDTETKTRFLAGGINTTPQQVMRLDRGGGGEPLPPATAQKLRSKLTRGIAWADLLVVSDYGLGTLAKPVVQEALRGAKRIPLLVDSRFDLRAWKGATYVKPNVPELEQVTGRRITDAASAGRAARALCRSLDAKGVLVTRGHDGLTLQGQEGRALHLSVFGPAEAVDVTGAGDTVLATFAVALASGADAAAAARLANVAGGLAVQKPGTAPVAALEILEALSR